MDTMDTLSQVLDKLRKEGYTVDFNLQNNCIECKQNNLKLFHEDFMIDKVYRFEGDSNPDDEATVYAISSPAKDIKGVLVNGAGIYTDEITDEMVQKLEIRPQ